MANKNNAMVGKPLVAGAIYRAAITRNLELPESATETLDGAVWHSVGYISDAGVVWGYGSDTDEIRAWGGDIVADAVAAVQDTARFSMIETIGGQGPIVYFDAVPSQQMVYQIGVPSPTRYAWVIDMLIPWRSGGAGDLEGDPGVRRIVIPSAAVGDRDDITYADDELIAYGVTLQADEDEEGNYHYEYVAMPETTLEITKQPPASAEIDESAASYTFGGQGEEAFCSISGSAIARLQKRPGGSSDWISISATEPPAHPTIEEFTLPIGDGSTEIQPGDALRIRINTSDNVFYSDVCEIVAAVE